MRIKINTRAQSIAEYALLIGIVAISLTTMQLYFKRGIQAAIKSSVDEFGPQESAMVKKDLESRGLVLNSVATANSHSRENTTTHRDSKRSNFSETGQATQDEFYWQGYSKYSQGE